jgi:transposase
LRKKASCRKIKTAGGFIMGKQYGKFIIGQVLEMKELGMTHQAIAEEYGLTKTQIKKLVERYNKRKRMPFNVPKQKGRPRKQPLITEQDCMQRIKQLEMEVELYRSFLQVAGRM